MIDEPVPNHREPIGFREVFAEELRSWIARRRLKRGPPQEVHPEQLNPDRAVEMHLSGLALSGGGIRSAVFNLGLLQALAEQGVLARVDYLSTVSGGGYIGASLTSLCASGAGVAPDTFPFCREAAVERPEVSHLRMLGGYLAPRRGLLRIDTWRMISAYLSGLVLIFLTVAVLLALVASANLGWAEGVILPGLEQKQSHELWMMLVQKRLTDVDFERVSDRRLRGQFIDWAGSFHAIVLDESLKKDLNTWIAEAKRLPVSRLRELVDVWVYACQEYANDRERLWNDLVNAIPENAVRVFAFDLGLRVVPHPNWLIGNADDLASELVRNNSSGTLREWWIRKVEDSLSRGGFQIVPNDKLKQAFEQWQQDDFAVLTGEPGVKLVPSRSLRSLVTRFGDWVGTAIRYRVARGSAPEISLESLRQEVEDRRVREEVDAWIAQWNRERISRNLLANTGAPVHLNDEAMRAELWNDVWRHPVPYAGVFFIPAAIGLGLWVFWGILFLAASVFPWRRELRLPERLTDTMGYALAAVAVLAALSSVPFVYAAIASFELSQVKAAGLSTLIGSGLSLLGSLRLGEGRGQLARKVKRVMFALGAWALIALCCASVIYFVIQRRLHGSYSFPISLDVLFTAMILLALITDVNRVSLLHFYRNRLAAAFVIRRSAPHGKPGPEASDYAPAVKEVTGAGSGRRLAHKVIRGLYSLGGWPLGALLIAVLAYSGQKSEQAWFLLSFVIVFVFLASGGFHAVIRWYKRKLWISGALAEVRGDEKDTEIVRNDDLRLSTLATSKSDAPYHLINAAVNLAGSEDLKLRGRKADFFLMSPLYCGSEVTGYVRTDQFERSLDNLATAMAVSGAATNPLYGRATHSAFGFLMALFNLRLGMWVQNPRYVRHAGGFRRWMKEALLPLRRWWPWYIVMELLGQSDERRRHVNLSDGGHIENLGVFELLRRRCRVIIASDAGADPTYGFADLADLTRMARVDLGVAIDNIDLDMLHPRESTQLSARHAVAGDIRYPGVEETASLIYVKAALTQDDPQDLHGYKRREPAFPHETTLDQFFNEGQFESYRMLGYQSGLAAADNFLRLMRP